MIKRSWDDHKERSIKKGQFSSSEIKKLENKITSYCSENSIQKEKFYEIITNPKKKDKSLRGIWPIISECLYNRSVRSIKSFCERKYNINNYKGKWSKDDISKLQEYIKKIGYKWVEIGDLMNRTSFNVRDKWKEIGEKNFFNRKKNWSFKETLKFIRLIEDICGVCILNDRRDFFF